MANLQSKIEELEASLGALKLEAQRVAESERKSADIHNTILGLYGKAVEGVLFHGIRVPCTGGTAYGYFLYFLKNHKESNMILSNIKYDGGYYFVVQQCFGVFTPYFHCYVEPYKVEGKLVMLRLTHITAKTRTGGIETIASWDYDTPPLEIQRRGSISSFP